MNANLTYLIVVALFIALLVFLGLRISKGIKTSEDWMVAGKTLGVIPMAGTYFATIISATSIISYMGYYYLNGWSGWWNCCGTLFTSFLACLYFAKRLRRTGYNTLPEYIGARFGETHALLASLLIVVCSMALLSAQVIGGVVILQAFVDWSEIVCCLILLVVFLAFTVMGGMKAVAWTDTLCSFIIIVGIWIMAIKVLGEVGGFTAMNVKIAAINPDFIKPFSVKIPPLTALSWFVTWGICNFGAPAFVARFFSAETPEVASRSQGLAGLGLLVFYVPLIIAGLCGMLLMPGIGRQDIVFASLVTNELHPILGGIMFAAVVAAIISTADSLLLLAASTFSNDIYKKLKKNVSDSEQLKVARITTAVIGIGSVILVFFINDAIQFIQAKAVTMMGAAMASLTMVGVAWKRANSVGGMAAMIAGFITASIWYAIGQPYGVMAALPSIVVSFVVLFVVSGMTTPPSEETIKKFFPEED